MEALARFVSGARCTSSASARHKNTDRYTRLQRVTIHTHWQGFRGQSVVGKAECIRNSQEKQTKFPRVPDRPATNRDMHTASCTGFMRHTKPVLSFTHSALEAQLKQPGPKAKFQDMSNQWEKNARAAANVQAVIMSRRRVSSRLVHETGAERQSDAIPSTTAIPLNKRRFRAANRLQDSDSAHAIPNKYTSSRIDRIAIGIYVANSQRNLYREWRLPLEMVRATSDNWTTTDLPQQINIPGYSQEPRLTRRSVARPRARETA